MKKNNLGLKVSVVVGLLGMTIGGMYVKSSAEDLDITVTSPNTTISAVTDLTTVSLKQSSLYNVEWNIKQNINWDNLNTTRKKLIYKSTNENAIANPIKVEFRNNTAMGISAEINEKALNNPYVVAVYSDEGNTIAGVKSYSKYNSTMSGNTESITDQTSGTIDGGASINGYMEVIPVENGKTIQLKKEEGGVAISDSPYKVNNNISISCSGDSTTKTVTVTPATGIKDIKEIGVRVEYTSGNTKRSVVKKTNKIDSETKSFTFKNMPGTSTYTAYCITYDNEEIKS